MIKFFKWVIIPKKDWEHLASDVDRMKTKYNECRMKKNDLAFEVRELQRKVRVREGETMNYKILYLDEQAKRLSLSKRVKELEGNG